MAVTLLAELALPLTVNEVLSWDDAQPGRLLTAAAEASIAGRALPLAPVDLVLARPDLFPTAAAAEHVLKREKGGQTLIKDYYKRLAPLSGLSPARYRKVGGRGSLALALVPRTGGREALEAIIGPLSAYEPPATEQAEPQPRARPAPEPTPIAPEPESPAMPLTPARISRLPDDAKLALRAGHQANAPAPDPDGALPFVGGGYGDLVDADVFRRPDMDETPVMLPVAGAWSVTSSVTDAPISIFDRPGHHIPPQRGSRLCWWGPDGAASRRSWKAAALLSAAESLLFNGPSAAMG